MYTTFILSSFWCPKSPTQFVWIFQSVQASTEEDFSLVMCMHILVFVHAQKTIFRL